MIKDRWPSTILKYFFLTLGAVIMAVPFLWMISTAFKTPPETNIWPPKLLPSQFRFDVFRRVFESAPFDRYFLNSLYMAAGTMVSILFTSSLAGYIFAKFKFPGKNALFALLLGTAIIPFEVYMIPLYVQVNKLNLINTYPGLLLPNLVMSFGIFFMRQAIIQQIPDELQEAARVEGASEWRIFFQIVLPLISSTLAALGIFCFMNGWNAFVWPLLVASSSRLFTMELGLANFQTAYSLDINLISAGSLISIAPVLIVFLFLRKQIITSISITGMK